MFSVAHQILLTDRTGVNINVLKAQNAAMIHSYDPLIKCVTSVFALTLLNLFPKRSKAFLTILETIAIYLESKMTSNKVFVTY